MMRDATVRLQTVLSRAGIASRRKVVEVVAAGRVTVNGTLVREAGCRVRSSDVIALDGRRIAQVTSHRYLMLNKPQGYLTTARDTHGRRTVFDLVALAGERVFPVGRLDRDTEGLLLFTNDGELTFRLTHPRFGVKRLYVVGLDKRISEGDIKRLQRGIVIDEEKTAPCRISVMTRSARTSVVSIEMGEGKKRQIRRMFEALGYGVSSLRRVRYGPLPLGSLQLGTWRTLTAREEQQLKHCVGLE